MKFYGHADLRQNEVQNAALTTLTTFPATPVVGQLAFVNSVVYICVTAGALPVWVPLTREITAYTHTQSIAATTWNIAHDLNTTSVNVQVYDNTSKVMIPADIQTLGSGDVQITFNNAQAGRAVLVSGHFDGQTKPTYAYTHYQNSSNTSWTIQHNLGYNPIVRVFVGNQEVQPTTITFTNSDQVVITFATAQVGYAQLI